MRIEVVTKTKDGQKLRVTLTPEQFKQVMLLDGGVDATVADVAYGSQIMIRRANG